MKLVVFLTTRLGGSLSAPPGRELKEQSWESRAVGTPGFSLEIGRRWQLATGSSVALPRPASCPRVWSARGLYFGGTKLAAAELPARFLWEVPGSAGLGGWSGRPFRRRPAEGVRPAGFLKNKNKKKILMLLWLQ